MSLEDRKEILSVECVNVILSCAVLTAPLLHSRLRQLLCPQLFLDCFIPSGRGVEEVGHAPHSSLWRQRVWIGSLYNTKGERSLIYPY